MTCKELVEFLDDYVSGEVSPTERETFDRHLGECRQCRAYLASYRSTIELAKRSGVETEADAEQMPDGLVRAILAARSNAGPSK